MSLYATVIMYLPGPLGYRLRYRYFKKRLKHLGDDVRFDVNVFIERPEWVSIGDHCAIDRGTMILSGPDRSARPRTTVKNLAFQGVPGHVSIGSGTHVSSYCIISGRGGVSIGQRCGLASKSTIHSFSHHYRSSADRGDDRVSVTPLVSADQQWLVEGPVVIGDNVGVALSAAILPGVQVGRNSFVNINSVLMPGARFPENSLIGGDPAKRLGPRFG